jgi:glutamine amidotransferase
MIAIIDYNAGNLRSVKKALDFLKTDSIVTSNPEEILVADRIILPGVGSFGESMKMLKKFKLIKPIKQSINDNKKFLGICLGLQLLFEKSEEDPEVKGFEIFKGDVVRFNKGKVPQIGWNEINPKKDFFKRGYAYFVNSYYVSLQDEDIIACTTEYEGIEFVSAIQKDNITAVQFHPEKSGDFGMKILEDWIKC